MTKAPYHGEPPAVSHSATSIAAAREIKRAIGSLHKRILDHLKEHPSTDEEMQSALDIGANTQRPRRRELQLMGYILDSGEVRPTSAGRSAVVWKLA